MKIRIPQATIIEACDHPRLLNIPLSLGQRVVLKSADGLEMTDEEIELFCKATGRTSYVAGRFHRDVVLACGRRWGKTFHYCVPVSCYAAAFQKYTNIRPGERPRILVLSVTMPQAALAWRGIVEVFRNSPTLKSLVRNQRRGVLELRNGVDVCVQKADLRSVRGFPIALLIAEECAFWRSEEDGVSNPSEEILAAVRPALLQFPNGRQALVSSVWAKSGPIWTAVSQRLEKESPLVFKMSSTEGNPTLDAALLAQEQARDPERYSREIDANFVDSASVLLPSDMLEACVARGRWENPPKPNQIYIAALDVAFRSDNFAFAIVHAEKERVIVDLVRSWKPKPGKPVQFAPVMEEIVQLSKHYGVTKAFSDMVANEVVKQLLATAGIVLEQVTTLGRRASGIYSTLRAKILAGQVELLDNPELVSQLRRLEVVRSGGGGERVESATGHDDVAVATALAIHKAVENPGRQPWSAFLRIGQQRPDGEEKSWHPLS